MFTKEQILLLKSESQITQQQYFRRVDLANQLDSLPDDALELLQYLQPQINCFNRCSFCSQGAGTTIWQLDKESLRDLFSALKSVLSKRNHAIGSNRVHRPKVIFPYLDNDVSTYAYLDEFIKYAYEDLGLKIRISTTGYSRYNTHNQRMHQKISETMADTFAGIRFSITPYTYGFTRQGEKSGSTSRKEYIEDLANLFKTYRHLIEKIGIGKKTACSELRFKPLVKVTTLKEEWLNGYHIIHCGPYLLISTDAIKDLPNAQITKIQNGIPIFSTSSQLYEMVISDSYIGTQSVSQLVGLFFQGKQKGVSFEQQLEIHLDAGKYKWMRGELYKLKNLDGHYYAVNCLFNENGFKAKHFYPQSASRISGYMDSERYFLNNLLHYKRKYGYKRRDSFPDATVADIEKVLLQIQQSAKEMSLYDAVAAKHITDEIFPLVEVYVKALKFADYPPSYFFDRRFTIDTGQIVNQGRALFEFKGLVSKEDTPLTPQEERGYGAVSFSSEREYVWRCSLMPAEATAAVTTLSGLGKKNKMRFADRLQFTKLDCRNLSTISPEGRMCSPEITIQGVELEKITLQQQEEEYLIPGSIKNKKN